MIRILDIAGKDLQQMLRDGKTFLFFLIMPIVFTLMFSLAFGGSGGDPRLPVGFRDEDQSRVSRQLHDLLARSKVVRLEVNPSSTTAELEAAVAEEELATAIIVPPGFGSLVLNGKPARLVFIGDTSTPAGTTTESEALTAYIRLDNAVRTAVILEEEAGDQAPFDYIFEKVLDSWDEPPISIVDRTSSAIPKTDSRLEQAARTSPGTMLQFAIAGLLVSASLIVTERKTHSLQRMLTTATQRAHILLGHYLAIFVMVFVQFLILLTFGQLFLKLEYFRAPFATLLVALSAALCLGAMGLLIGTLAKTDEQAIIYSLVPMFIFAGLGGAWVPLEITGPTFQAIGHLTPVAWAMDGFKNITIRGQGLESALLPAGALLGYALLFFLLAVWRFRSSQEH
jgi:ABC-2 type transport system permease protein